LGQDDPGVEHSNAVAYRQTADAFRARDTEALAGLIDVEVVWHVPGTHPLAGEIRGREALFRWFERLHQVTEGTFTLKEHDVLGTDDHVVALSDMSAIRDGVRVSVSVVSVMHFREGRQQERWFHPSDPTAWDALLGLGYAPS
jgi:ketosteroid isomerase-like protein